MTHPGRDSTVPGNGATARLLTGSNVLVAALAFAVYAATLSNHPSWDALRYAAATAAHTPASLTSAHHIMGGLLGYALYRIAQALGWHLEALRALQLTSAAGAAVAVGGLHAALRAEGASATTALGTAAALAASLAFWEVATDAEVYAVAAAALIIAYCVLLRAARGDDRTMVWAGVASGAAVLGHQLNAVVVLSAALYFRRARRSPRAWTLFLTAIALTVAAGYACAFVLSDRSASWDGFMSWTLGYLRAGFHFPRGDPLTRGPLGLAASLVNGSGGMADLAALAVLAIVVAVCTAAWRAAWSGRAHAFAASAALAAFVAAVLATWWEPQSLKFWVPTLVCGWLAVGLALSREPARRASAVALCAAAIALLNLAVIVPRNAEPNSYRDAAREFAAVTAPADLIIVGSDLLLPHLEYYAVRPHATNLFAVFRPARGRSDVRTQLDALLDATRARNGKVFLTSDAFAIPPDRRAMAPNVPASAAELVPDAKPVPVLRYTVRGSQRALFEIVPDRRRADDTALTRP